MSAPARYGPASHATGAHARPPRPGIGPGDVIHALT